MHAWLGWLHSRRECAAVGGCACACLQLVASTLTDAYIQCRGLQPVFACCLAKLRRAWGCRLCCRRLVPADVGLHCRNNTWWLIEQTFPHACTLSTALGGGAACPFEERGICCRSCQETEESKLILSGHVLSPADWSHMLGSIIGCGLLHSSIGQCRCCLPTCLMSTCAVLCLRLACELCTCSCSPCGMSAYGLHVLQRAAQQTVWHSFSSAERG